MTKLPTTKLQRLIRRPASERGFTLIELLVVIIILGILAAVVVFAVSGVGDKGKSSAVSIDERTLQTAQEAYCAKNGRYGSGQQLVDGQFLSDKPQYHDVYARQDGGSCNGWSFSLAKTPKGDPDSGRWTAATPLAVRGFPWVPIRLPNGKVIAFVLDDLDNATLGVAEWDWATGQWTAKDSITIDSNTSPINHPVLIEDDPSTPASECGTNCGKILLRTGYCGNTPTPDPLCQPWYLFNPQAGTWENLVSSAAPIRGGFDLRMLVQLHDDPAVPGNQCGDNCGKILIRSVDRGEFELYDPKKAINDPTAFTAFSYSDPSAQNLSENAVLPDGRVLFFGARVARLFDPGTLLVSLAGIPARRHDGFGLVRYPVLPSGELLVTSHERTQIYTPVVGGPGSWRFIAGGNGCPTFAALPMCLILGSLPDGRVLAYSSMDTRWRNFNSHTGKAWIFDPASGPGRWVQTSDLLDRNSVEGVLLDPRTGPCGDYCNKFLVVGPNTFPTATAYYTP